MIKKYSIKLLIFFSRISWKISRLISGVATRIDDVGTQQDSVIRSTRYDMLKSNDEPYYADQYWSIIEPHLANIPDKAKILDLGCSQGRFTLKLATRFPIAKITACDISSSAITQANQYASHSGVGNIEFREQDIADCLQECESDSFDVIFMTEVAFFYPGWKSDLPKIAEALKPGGIFILSNRSQFFNGLCLLRNRQLSMIDMLLNRRCGEIFGPATVFTWQTSQEIRKLLEKNHFHVIEQRGIGVCSGIPGDPHDIICRPSLLRDDERIELMKLELELGISVPDAGRYILAIAIKPT